MYNVVNFQNFKVAFNQIVLKLCLKFSLTMLIKFNNIKKVSVVMIYKPLKLQLRAFLADQTVSTLVTYYVTKMITYLPMIGQFF